VKIELIFVKLNWIDLNLILQMKIYWIAAVSKNLGLGYQQRIPWHLEQDLKHFAQLTTGHIVVMGRVTYESIPEERRPLKGRLNVVVTHQPLTPTSSSGVIYADAQGIEGLLTQLESDPRNVFVCGGASIYQIFQRYSCHRVYLTHIEKEYPCDRFFVFPTGGLQLDKCSSRYVSETEQCSYRFLEYQCEPRTSHGEFQYLNLLQDIFDHGNHRDDRTGTGTLGVFGRQIRFDLSQSFPLLTTKFVPFKMIVKELLWFLKGETDNQILQKQGVHIWDGNSTREFLDKLGLTDYCEGDIGSMYGWQWRHFGAQYRGCHADYTGQGIDQLESVMHSLRTDPFSRRIAMTTYNVADLEKGVLHPCHGIFVQFYVEGASPPQTPLPPKLSCHMTQRSVDCGCGLPFNIASYAILTYIIALKVNMVPGELIISTGDTHIYHNHLEALRQQLTRVPYPFPQLKLADSLREKPWEDINVDDFELIGYFSHPAIKLVMNV